MKVQKGFVFVDLETSVSAIKALAGQGDIIQIAAIVVDEYFNTLEVFERKIQFVVSEGDPDILKKVHFDETVWSLEAKPALLVAEEFLALCKKYAFLTKENNYGYYQFGVAGGHNISGFDLPMLFNWYTKLNKFYGKKMQLPLQYQPCLDTLSLINLYEFRNQNWFLSHKLPDLCNTFNIKLETWHDALSDITASIEIAKYLIKEI